MAYSIQLYDGDELLDIVNLPDKTTSEVSLIWNRIVNEHDRS